MVLRVGFGLIWILDGILQAQPKMAGGLASQVIQPTAAASPSWVQHVVNWGGTIWSFHPIAAGAASVWIQIGIGIWLLVARSGPWSRLAGLASVAWGLVVWVFGESFGGIFAAGLSWLTGAPGAVLIYVVAGALIALPEDAWRSPRLGRLLLGGIGVFFIGMAVLQAWPGRGFWRGNDAVDVVGLELRRASHGGTRRKRWVARHVPHELERNRSRRRDASHVHQSVGDRPRELSAVHVFDRVILAGHVDSLTGACRQQVGENSEADRAGVEDDV